MEESIKTYKELSVKEYADSLNLTPQAIYKQIRKAQVSFKKIGFAYIILVENLSETN